MRPFLVFQSSKSRYTNLVLAAGLTLVALVALVRSDLLAGRLRPVDGVQGSLEAAQRIVRVSVAPLGAVAALAILSFFRIPQRHSRSYFAVAVVLLVASYVSLTSVLSDWLVDDAAITFAYSENLVRGHGLVLHPKHAPEEGYSSTLWMLILAAARAGGLAIPTAAKLFGLAAGALSIALAAVLSLRLSSRRDPFTSSLLFAAVATQASFLIWTSSGLEHSLQALVLVLVGGAPLLWSRSIGPTGLLLGALVLLRPETPLFVAAALAVHGYFAWRRGGPRSALRIWPVAVVPIATSLSLLAFRLAYFGDPLPNPYYAKAADATPLRFVNLVGGGWGYVFDWLGESGAYLAVPLILMGLGRASSRDPHPAERGGATDVTPETQCLAMCVALVLAQAGFAIFAGGDWMREYRFMAPIPPLLAILCVASHEALVTGGVVARARGVAASLVIVTIVGTLASLHRFRAQPTTPTAIVERIGRTFTSLAAELGVTEPTLAHHDAGGTSFGARIDVIDLGGLGNRLLARHMGDRPFVRRYVFEERRPTFIFGSDAVFTAGRTKLREMSEFERDYVALVFPSKPYMKAPLCHVRRDIVEQADRVTLVRDESQRVVRVLVQ